MDDRFYAKDYRDYFSKLEKSIEKKNRPEKPCNTLEEGTVSVKGRKRKNRGRIKKSAVLLTAVVLSVASIIVMLVRGRSTTGNPSKDISPGKTADREQVAEKMTLFAEYDDNTASVTADIESDSVIFVNITENHVVAERNASKRLYPASTTKIMTLLLAAESIADLDDTFTMTYEITDPLYLAGASAAGFLSGETVTVRDLLYGTILPSGADAAVGLAVKIAGSEAAFAKLMNKKAEELGLKDTHFVNVSGLYDADHYSTAEDIAVILRAAMGNELCREILSTYQYTTSATAQHPEGILLTSTLFSYMYGTEPEGAQIKGGKTGYTYESGYCIATFGMSDTGEEYICVVMNCVSKWPAVYDQINLYSALAE